MTRVLNGVPRLLPLIAALLKPVGVLAEIPLFKLEIRDHLFWPAEIVIPAHLKVRLQITNSDPSPEEFESYELNREKVIIGNHTVVIYIGPLEPGEYLFFGEFNPDTAQGRVIAE